MSNGFYFTINSERKGFVKIFEDKQHWTREVVVAQLVEWSLPIPEVSGSNPSIGKIYFLVYYQLG